MRLLEKITQEEFPLIFACPALIWQVLFVYAPFVIIFLSSISDHGATGGYITSWTFAHYTAIFQRVYFTVLFNSLMLALLTTFICLLIAYPVAYFIALHVKRFRTLLLFSLILPSWTNFIVQVYAWFFLLEKGGLYSQLAYQLGLTAQLPHFLNTYASTLVGMIYCFLPFMIFPIYAVLDRMDKILFEVAADLGSSRLQTFWRVILPLSLPGVYVGILLVFVPAFGEFAVPLLLGGSKNMYWGTVIVEKFLVTRDWASGFAFASVGIIFLLSFVLLIVAFVRFYRFLMLWKLNTYGAPVQKK